MSNPYKAVQNISRTITLAISTLLANSAKEWLVAHNSWASITILLALAIVIGLSHLLAFLFDLILNHSRFLRSIFFRGYYVEGSWVDLTIEGEQVIAIGLTCLEIRDFDLCWYGENHNLKGRVTSSFRTYTSIIEWPKVRFWFKNDPSDNQSRMLEGLCELLFEQHACGFPIHYSGWGGTIAEPGITKMVGWKITDKKKIEALHSARTRAATLLTVAREFAEFNHNDERTMRDNISLIPTKADG